MRWFLFPLIVLLLIIPSILHPQKAEAAVTIVHNFAGMPSDGGNPCDLAECSLLLDNGVFYGMTEEGGTNNLGTIFKMNVDGSGYTLLRQFSGGNSDGSSPRGSLIKSGSVLYGTTGAGGPSDYGTVFKINTDGTGFSILHSFDLTNGATPTSSVVLVGSILYGSTSGGGASQDGTLYKINTDGTSFSVIHELDGDTEGTTPGGIIIDSGTIYGMTSAGGTSNKGTIYKISTSGSGMTVLRQFSGLLTNGALPYGSLLMYQSKLYGMTNEGGSSNFGAIFRINTDGTGFSILHSFVGGANEGQWPGGGLTENNGVFYGMTYYGGDLDYGTVFQMNADGSSFSTLHEFLGGASDGQYSNGNLVFNTANSRLYGMTVYGGSSDNGTIFYYQTAVPTPTSTPTPTNSPTPTPGGSTPTPTSGSNSNSSSNSSSPISTACTKQPPSSSPDLFQVNTTTNTATLYFSPAKAPYDSYYVSFGNGNSDEGFGASFQQGKTNGVITYTVSSLSPNSNYTFKVRAANGCMPGGWSSRLTVKTIKSGKYFPQSIVSYTVNYIIPKTVQKIKNNIPLVEKQPEVINKKVTGVKKIISPNPIQSKSNKSLLNKIFGLF